MRSLILKMFLCYWVAAGLVIVISNLPPHKQIQRPEVTAALTASLRLQGRAVSAAYEAGGCGAITHLSGEGEERIYLSAGNGDVLCGEAPARDLKSLAAAATSSSTPVASNFRDFQIVAMEVNAESGKPY